MLKTIYVVRHGETDWNRDGKLQGWANTHLNKTGIEQAKKIAKWFENIKIDNIYSSDLARTQETARFLCQSKKRKVLTTNLLRGRNFNQVAGLTWDELKASHPDIYKNIMDESDEVWSKLGIEPIMSLKSRIQSFFNKIDPNDEHIILITHGATRRHILRFFALITSTQRPKTSNASITIIDISNKSKFTYKTINDIDSI